MEWSCIDIPCSSPSRGNVFPGDPPTLPDTGPCHPQKRHFQVLDQNSNIWRDNSNFGANIQMSGAEMSRYVFKYLNFVTSLLYHQGSPTLGQVDWFRWKTTLSQSHLVRAIASTVAVWIQNQKKKNPTELNTYIGPVNRKYSIIVIRLYGGGNLCFNMERHICH